MKMLVLQIIIRRQDASLRLLCVHERIVIRLTIIRWKEKCEFMIFGIYESDFGWFGGESNKHICNDGKKMEEENLLWRVFELFCLYFRWFVSILTLMRKKKNVTENSVQKIKAALIFRKNSKNLITIKNG